MRTGFKSVERTAGRQHWRFSLAGLFRVMAVCALAAFAATQFGPLAAARDMGMGLAIALAIGAFFTRGQGTGDRGQGARRRRMLVAAGVVALFGFVPTVLAAGAPFSERSAVCMECGRQREIHEVCGWTTKDEITDTEASRWAAPMLPAGHAHAWTGCSNHYRTEWFGWATIGCGGPGEGAFMAWQLARLGDQAAAEQAYQEYLDIRAGKSTKSMAVHRKEVADKVDAAVAARP